APWRLSPHSAKSVAGLYLATTPQTALVLQLSLTLSLQKLSASYACNKGNTYNRQMSLMLPLMALNKNDVTSAVKIALAIDKIYYSQRLGSCSLIKQLMPRALE
ncbi:hypothetical protein GGH92_002384, partial [Coemansia sp. RSA 2673]